MSNNVLFKNHMSHVISMITTITWNLYVAITPTYNLKWVYSQKRSAEGASTQPIQGLDEQLSGQSIEKLNLRLFSSRKDVRTGSHGQ